jgi:hypothetical protein
VTGTRTPDATQRASMDVRDELDIRNLVARIAWLTDNWSSIEEFLENYTPDATWEIDGLPPYVGHEGIGRRVEEVLDEGVCGPGLAGRHCIAAIEVIPDPTDPKRAVARHFGFIIDLLGGDPQIKGYSQKHDYVHKGDDGVWRVTRRVIELMGWQGGGTVTYKNAAADDCASNTSGRGTDR